MSRQRVAIGVIAIIAVFLFLAIPARFSAPCKRALMQLSSPLLVIGNATGAAASRVKGAFASRRALARENAALKERVRELEKETLILEAVKSECEGLRRLLAFESSPEESFVAASIVGRDARTWYSSVLIDRGSREGVAGGMPVMSEAGVVGKVIEAAPSVSKVLLIVDRRSRLGGRVERTREVGIVEGTSFNTCRLNYLPRQAEARPGDRVVTSGLGGVYPKGLYIGRVEKVYDDEYGLYRYADVSPAVNFATLEEVYVMVPGEEGARSRGLSGPPGTPRADGR